MSIKGQKGFHLYMNEATAVCSCSIDNPENKNKIHSLHCIKCESEATYACNQSCVSILYFTLYRPLVSRTVIDPLPGPARGVQRPRCVTLVRSVL